MFGSNEKWNFPENHFLLTEIYSFDPEMILHSHFHFKSFSGHAKHREREKEQHRERASKTQREREKERELWSSHRHRSTSRRSCWAQPNDHQAKRRRPTVSESSNSHRSNPMHPIQLSQSITVQPLRSPSQTQTHSEFSETDSPSTHSPHLWSTHLTGPTHPPDPPLDLISALYIYLFIYINIYIIIYFF